MTAIIGQRRISRLMQRESIDSAKILVITHLEELKDAFPTRIEIEKTERGSTIRVI